MIQEITASQLHNHTFLVFTSCVTSEIQLFYLIPSGGLQLYLTAQVRLIRKKHCVRVEFGQYNLPVNIDLRTEIVDLPV